MADWARQQEEEQLRLARAAEGSDEDESARGHGGKGQGHTSWALCTAAVEGTTPLRLPRLLLAGCGRLATGVGRTKPPPPQPSRLVPLGRRCPAAHAACVAPRAARAEVPDAMLMPFELVVLEAALKEVVNASALQAR